MNQSNIIRFSLRAFKQHSHIYSRNSLNFLKSSPSFIIINRPFTFRESVESVAKTQSGIFKSLSESTPVEYLQNFLVKYHDLTGLPWWATIITTTILLRTFITLPLAVYQNYIMAKVKNLHLEMPAIVKELKRETAIAIKMFNWDERTAKRQYKKSLKKQWNALIVRDNCHPFKAFLILWFQIPMWICYSVSLRNLVYMLPTNDVSAQITFMELSLGGFGWIPSLAAADSSFILPVTLGLTNLAIIELQNLSRTRESTKLQKYTTNFFRGLSVVMIPIAASVPSCLALYWTTSSAVGLLQNVTLMSPKIKRFCRIPQTKEEIEKPYQHVLMNFKNTFRVDSTKAS